MNRFEQASYHLCTQSKLWGSLLTNKSLFIVLDRITKVKWCVWIKSSSDIMEVQIGTQTEEDNQTYGIINQTTKLCIQITLTIPEYLQKPEKLIFSKLYTLCCNVYTNTWKKKKNNHPKESNLLLQHCDHEAQ